MLLNDFLTRHKVIEDRLIGVETDFGSPAYDSPIIELGRPAGQLLSTAIGLPDSNFTSWLAGFPLPALLASGRRITVDLAPSFLENSRRNYGISEDALIIFAKAEMLLFNIRDFDPLALPEQRETQALAYQRYERFLGRLFDEAPNSTYFLPTLRPRIFDRIPVLQSKKPVPKPGLNDTFEIARRDLKGAARAAMALKPRDSAAVRAMFRTEFADPVATFWHWAYVSAVHRYVDPELVRDLQQSYDALADEPEHGHVGSDDSKAFELGTKFVLFQMRMRYAHLLYSAPLSASFGGAYGYSLDDEHLFMQAVERQRTWAEDLPFDYDFFADDLLDLIQDLQIGVLRPRFADRLEPRYQEMLSSIGCELYCRTERTSYFDHYSDPENQAELISYWQDRSWRRISYEGLQSQFDTLIGKEDLSPRDLIDLASMKQEAREASDRMLRRYTENFQVRTSPNAENGRFPGKICVTDPKEPHLLMRLLIRLGLRTGNGGTSVGKRGDYGRSAYSGGSGFRNFPM